MEVKKIYVEAKKTKNYQSYTVGFEATVGFNENVEELTKELQARCRRLATEQLKIDSGDKQ